MLHIDCRMAREIIMTLYVATYCAFNSSRISMMYARRAYLFPNPFEAWEGKHIGEKRIPGYLVSDYIQRLLHEAWGKATVRGIALVQGGCYHSSALHASRTGRTRCSRDGLVQSLPKIKRFDFLYRYTYVPISRKRAQKERNCCCCPFSNYYASSTLFYGITPF